MSETFDVTFQVQHQDHTDEMHTMNWQVEADNATDAAVQASIEASDYFQDRHSIAYDVTEVQPFQGGPKG